MADHIHTRRSFLRGAGQLAVGTALVGSMPTLLSACSTDSSQDAEGSFGKLTYQLGWIKSVQYAGSYIAVKEGYYLKEGFDSVDLMAGGPSAPPIEAVVSSGNALVGVSSPAATADAIVQGARLKIVGAQYQRSPYCIISLSEKPITTPEAMLGRRIGVPQNNQPTWNAFLALNELSSKDITVVPVGFNPSVLPDGQVDGLMAFVSNEPIQLSAQGVETHVMRMSDFGYAVINNDYVMSEKTLKERPEVVKAFFRAELRGWKRSVADARLSAELTVNEFGSDLGLDLDGQVEQSKVQNTLIVSDETRQNGMFTLSPRLVASTVEVLQLTGVNIAAEQLFALDLLESVLADDPTLR